MNDTNKPLCIFQAPLFTRSGYGDLGMALAKSILRYNKFEVQFVATKWGGCSRRYSFDDINSDEREIVNRMLKQPLTKQPEIFFQVSIPNEAQAIAKYNILCTAGIETTVARPEWVDGLNRMNFSIVTSNHAKNIFENNTYQIQPNPNVPPQELKSLKPIEVLFWGANTSIYKKSDESSQLVNEELNKINESFCFLFVGQWTHNNIFHDRKDIGNLIKTFLETFSNFGNKPKPALILKISGAAICNMDKYDMINRIKAIKDHVKNSKKTDDIPNVYLIYGDLTNQEMNSLFNHQKVKVHISFTHGEGFGHPLLLATLSGKPIIAPNWSGHLDFLDPKLCKLLDGDVVQLPPESINEWLIDKSKWFVVDYKKAEEELKNHFYYYGSFLEKAEQLRIKNMENFSEEAMDKVFHSLLDKYIPKFAIETKLILPKLKKIELPKLNISKSIL